MTRWRWLGLAATLAMCVTASSAAPALIPITVQSNPTITNAPIYIAVEEGYFAAEGVEVRPVRLRDTPQVWALLATGRMDVQAGSYGPGFLEAIRQGARVRMVAGKGHTGPGDDSNVFMVRTDLIESGRFRTLRDLRGMRIRAGNRGGAGDLFVRLLVRNRALLTDRDVQIHDLTQQVVPDALRSKTIDAAVVSQPQVARIEAAGLARTVITMNDVMPNTQYVVLIYGTSIMSRNPGLGQRFMNGFLRGVRQYHQGKTDRNIASIGKHTGDDEALLRAMRWPLIHADGRVNVDSVMFLQSWWVREGLLSEIMQPAQFLDMSFARRAYRALGGDR